MARAVRSDGMVLHGDRGCDHLGCDRVSPVLPPSQGLGGVLDATSGIVTPTRAIGQARPARAECSGTPPNRDPHDRGQTMAGHPTLQAHSLESATTVASDAVDFVDRNGPHSLGLHPFAWRAARPNGRCGGAVMPDWMVITAGPRDERGGYLRKPLGASLCPA